MIKNERSKDFRYVYANGMKMQFGPIDVILTFGIKEDLASSEEAIFEEVGIVLTPVTAKLLAMSLTRTIEHVEKTSNIEIPIDPAKSAYVDNILRAADAQTSDPSTS